MNNQYSPGTHSLFEPGNVAVITGAASGIGLAAAKRFLALGMNVVLFDRDEGALADLASANPDTVRYRTGDVSRYEDLEKLKDLAFSAYGSVNVLMNNAAIGGEGSDNWKGLDAWRRVIDVNLWGVVNGVQAFTAAMLAQNAPGAIINTGSKQGITNPPGVPAYGTAKAAVKAMTEQLAHGLREEQASVTAHLLVPGWTYTGLTHAPDGKQPKGSWLPEQVVERMIHSVNAGDFYIICPDDAVTPEVDAKRILWSAGDIAENRPALSRWDPKWKEQFDAFLNAPKG